MSKFNHVYDRETTVNKEGFTAFAMDPKSKLVSQVLTSFFNESKFYGDNSEELVATLKDVIRTDPEFISKLAVFARSEFNMRSVSHVLTGYLANMPEGKPYVRQTVKNIVLRGDDATEILAFYLNTFGKPIPNSLRKALRDVFVTFDAYTLAKYKGNGPVKMKDVLCLTHPAPASDVDSILWKELLEDKLQPAYTWETELSAKGNTKETWEELIASNRVGYMALLRNLRNIINADPSNMRDVLDKLSNEKEVRKSKQLPFRYLSAYRNVPSESWWSVAARNAMDTAADYSIENLPKIPGKTIISIDVSGSMTSRISGKSDVRCSDIALLLGVIANRICENARVFTFDNYIEELRIPKRNGVISTAESIRVSGGGTDMYLPFQKMLNENIDCDRIIILSDNECNCEYGWYGRKTVQDLADEYRASTGNDIWVHAIDLQGYGTQQFKGEKTNVIAGWSEKIFEFIKLAEDGTDNLVDRIARYQLCDC